MLSKKKLKGISPLNLNVNPMRKLQKLLKRSSVRQTDYSLLVDLSKVPSTIIDGYVVYSFSEPQGAYLVKNFTAREEQLRISQNAINKFILKPYRTNLSGQGGLYQQNSHHEQSQEENEPQIKSTAYNFDERIRWSNLGYNYDWTLRKYPATKTSVPSIISELCQRSNQLFNKITHKNKSYHAEAVIVNYYREKDSMTAHLDDAQQDQDSPIYSFSFGLSCVFVIGGETKETQPIAVRLDSGDIFIMAGQSRKCYHGVPRIIENSYVEDRQHWPQETAGPNSLLQTQAYLKSNRININVRQVYVRNESAEKKTLQEIGNEIPKPQSLHLKDETVDLEVGFLENKKLQ